MACEALHHPVLPQLKSPGPPTPFCCFFHCLAPTSFPLRFFAQAVSYLSTFYLVHFYLLFGFSSTPYRPSQSQIRDLEFHSFTALCFCFIRLPRLPFPLAPPLFLFCSPLDSVKLASEPGAAAVDLALFPRPRPPLISRSLVGDSQNLGKQVTDVKTSIPKGAE